MPKFITKTLITSVAVLLGSYLIKGVFINSVTTAIMVAIVLGLLNSFVRPILIMLTIPFTVFTLGLFLLVINILIIKIAAEIVPGFHVRGWISPLLFSFLISIVTSIIEAIIKRTGR